MLVLVIAAVVGGLTSPGQQYLPDPVRPLANSAGPWFLTVLVVVYVSRVRLVPGIVLGIVGFWMMVLAYYLLSGWRGYPAGGLVTVWAFAAVLVGPVVGITALWLRSPRTQFVAIAAGVPAAVLIGEGAYGLLVVMATTGPLFWIIEIVAGVTILAAIAVTRIRRSRWILLSVGLALAGAALFFVGYRLV